MKKILSCLLFPVLFCACYENESVDITVMPDETTVGANTFGCLVDGWIYVGGRFNTGPFGFAHHSIEFYYLGNENKVLVSVEVKLNVHINFVINHPEEGKTTSFTDASFGEEELPNGTILITRFDKDQQIICGRFEGGRITHGRFDVIYKTN